MIAFTAVKFVSSIFVTTLLIFSKKFLREVSIQLILNSKKLVKLGLRLLLLLAFQVKISTF